MRAPPTPAPRKSNAMLNHRPARKEVYNKPPKSKYKPPKQLLDFYDHVGNLDES